MGECSIMPVNLCGIENQAKIAHERYFYENQPKIVALNETRKTLDTIHFENSFTESYCHDLEVVMLIGRSVLHARVTELEIKHFDSLLITILLENTKQLVSTTYIRPPFKKPHADVD